MKKIILFAAVATVFSTALTSCKKEPGLPPESVVYTPPVLESEHLLKGVTLYTGSGIFNLGVNFTPPERGSIRFINVNMPVIGTNVITVWRLSDGAIVLSKTLKSSDLNSGANGIEVNIPVEANIKYSISSKASGSYQVAPLP